MILWVNTLQLKAKEQIKTNTLNIYWTCILCEEITVYHHNYMITNGPAACELVQVKGYMYVCMYD